MASRTLTVKVVGNDAGASRAIGKVGESAHKTGGLLGELKTHAKALVGAFIGFEAIHKGAEFLKDATKAAADDQAQLAILANQANKAGVSWKTHGAAIDSTITKMSTASGFIKADLVNSFGRLVTATGSATKSTQMLNDAENLARARHIDLQSASQIMIKANMGNVGALKRLGIEIPGVTKGMTKQQIAMLALAVIHKKYAGAADAYSKTAAGQLAKLGASWDQVKVKVGNEILPILGKFAAFLTGELPSAFETVKKSITDHIALLKDIALYLGIAGAAVIAYMVVTKTVAAAQAIWTGLKTAIFLARNAQIALNVAMEMNPIGLVIGALALLVGGLILAYQHSATFRNIVNAAFNAVKTAAQVALGWITNTGIPAVIGAWNSAQPVVRLLATIIKTEFNLIKGYIETVVGIVSALMHGNFSQAFDIAKAAVGKLLSKVGDVMSSIGGAISDALPGIASAALRVGLSIFNSVKSGIGDIGGWLVGKLRSAVNGAIDRLNSLLNFSVRVDTHIPGVGTQGVTVHAGQIPHLATGGIVTKPTYALIGERGPEAVVPLGRGGWGGGDTFILNQVPANADSQQIAAALSWGRKTVSTA